MGILFKKPDFTIPEGGIDSVERLMIGGIEQYILIQGEKADNPILLFLHGGPSMPMPGISSRGRDYTVATNTKDLVKEFIVVFWDQRGTGKSYHPAIPQESMNVEQFIKDANEVTDYVRNRFGQTKIFLAAHSFGTLIGLQLVKRHPEKFHSYTGISQIVSWTENDKLSYTWALQEAERRRNRKALSELKAVGEPPYVESFEQWSVLRKWQVRFHSLTYPVEAIKHPGMVPVMMDLFRSKDYSLKDIYNTFYKGFKLVYTKSFIDHLPHINMATSVQDVEIPVTFIHGRNDVHVHGQLLEAYARSLNAPRGKRVVWLDLSSHMFHPIDTKAIETYLISEKYR